MIEFVFGFVFGGATSLYAWNKYMDWLIGRGDDGFKDEGFM
jgi:hypothetical protein